MNDIVYRKLNLESLEQKKLLAADVGLSELGVLEITGTDGNDTVVVRQNSDWVVVKTEGERIKFARDSVSSILFAGGDGDDVFKNRTDLPSVAYGNDGDDLLIGGRANDELRGGPGNDKLVGRKGDDSLHGDYGDDELRGGSGDDSLHGWFGNDLLVGGAGNDYLSGYEGDDVLKGNKGDDVLKGHEGNDVLLGQAGNDKLYGWTGDDLLRGGKGDDYLSGWSGDDILLGGHGNDHLRGHSGNDLLFGGKGADLLDGGSGSDLMSTGRIRLRGNFDQLDQVLETWSSDAPIEERHQAISEFITNSVRANDSQTDEVVADVDDLLLLGKLDGQAE